MPRFQAPLTPPSSSPPSRSNSPPPFNWLTPPPSSPSSRASSPPPSIRNSRSDPSACPLSVPRILCLHGGGTNARIFRLQCRVLSRILSPRYRLVFAQAPFHAQPGPDVTSVYKQYAPFKGWLQSAQNSARVETWDESDDDDDHVHGRKYNSRKVVDTIVDSLHDAMSDDDACGATGEWVGIMGFSQGAKVAASILLTQQILRRQQSHAQRRSRQPAISSLPEFQFGILLAGRGPLVWLAPDANMPQPAGMVEASRPSIMGVTDEEALFGLGNVNERLRTPTLHVHGLNDPGLRMHRKMMERWCVKEPMDFRGARRGATLLQWDGEHRVAIKRKDVDVLVEAISEMAMNVGC